MDWTDFTTAVDDAKQAVERGDYAIQRLGKLMVGRLRSAGVSSYVLSELKRELQDFNRVTGTWKERP